MMVVLITVVVAALELRCGNWVVVVVVVLRVVVLVLLEEADDMFVIIVVVVFIVINAVLTTIREISTVTLQLTPYTVIQEKRIRLSSHRMIPQLTYKVNK